MSTKEEPKQETFKNHPVIIVRNDDKEEFIHLSNGMYRTKWGIINNSISTTPLEAFDKAKFTFYPNQSETIFGQEEPKKETIEEAAEHYAHNWFDMHDTNNYKALRNGFIAGVEWKEEQLNKQFKQQ
jgi:hypothetical protein